MTKADLVEIVYEKIGGLSKKESQDIVEAIFETMKANLKEERRSRSRIRQLHSPRQTPAEGAEPADRRRHPDHRAPRADVPPEPDPEVLHQ